RPLRACSSLFPYTTLFRSYRRGVDESLAVIPQSTVPAYEDPTGIGYRRQRQRACRGVERSRTRDAQDRTRGIGAADRKDDLNQVTNINGQGDLGKILVGRK